MDRKEQRERKPNGSRFEVPGETTAQESCEPAWTEGLDLATALYLEILLLRRCNRSLMNQTCPIELSGQAWEPEWAHSLCEDLSDGCYPYGRDSAS